jgi:hypothetical protein
MKLTAHSARPSKTQGRATRVEAQGRSNQVVDERQAVIRESVPASA